MKRSKRRAKTTAGQGGNKYRKQLRFWLDMGKPEELALYETIEGLKGRGQYTAAVRDGIALVVAMQAVETSLRSGDVPPSGALRKLEAEYPHTLSYIRELHHSAELERLRAELAELRGSVHTSGIAPPVYKPRTSTSDLKVSAVVLNKGEASRNFMNAMKGFGKK